MKNLFKGLITAMKALFTKFRKNTGNKLIDRSMFAEQITEHDIREANKRGFKYQALTYRQGGARRRVIDCNQFVLPKRYKKARRDYAAWIEGMRRAAAKKNYQMREKARLENLEKDALATV